MQKSFTIIQDSFLDFERDFTSAAARTSAYITHHHRKLTWKVQTFWKVQSVSTPQAIKTRLISIYSSSRLPGQKIIITINWPKEAKAEEEFNKLFLILCTTTSWWPEPHHNLQVKIRLEQNSFIQWCYWCSLYFVHTGHFLGYYDYFEVSILIKLKCWWENLIFGVFYPKLYL